MFRQRVCSRIPTPFERRQLVWVDRAAKELGLVGSPDQTWSSDGSPLAFRSNRDGSQNDVYEKLASATAPKQLMFASSEHKVALDWSRDGHYLLYWR